jgi:hypothetical protein
MFQKIINTGVKETYPEYLQKKIVLSNQIAIITATCVALPFILLTYMFFRPITLLPVLGLLGSLSTFFFNAIGLHTLARIIISLAYTILSIIYGGFVSKAGEPVLPSFPMLSLSFSFIFFMVFDLREKGALILTGLMVFVIILSMDYVNNWLEIDLLSEIVTTGWLHKLSVVIAMVTAGASIFVLIYQNFQSELKSSEFRKQAEASQKEMQNKEEELKENLKQLEKAKKEEERRQWLNEGLTQANTIMRNQQEYKKLGEELISFIVKYTKSTQGGLFVVKDENENDKHIELLSAYAYDRKKFIEKRIEIGQGLLGQCYLEKEPMYLKEIPENYVNITSGLGDSNPRILLIVPMQTREEIIGLIELASFNEFSSHEIDFMKALAENIASTFRERKINMETKFLLEKSQQQAEEMRAQEEEMLQNMEELQATQEEVQRQKKREADTLDYV